jgi:putative ABC transport system permease protein
MLRAALRDLQWRRRRFVITVTGTALVFAMSLLMSGLSNSFDVEVDRTLGAQAADHWITRNDAAGAFSPGSLLSDGDVTAVADSVGGRSAPVLYGSSTVETRPGETGNEVLTVAVFGIVDPTLGAPASGITGLGDGSIVVPESVGVSVGDTVRLAGNDMVVSQVVGAASVLGGTPCVTITLADARRLVLGGTPLSSMVVTTGSIDTLPTEFRAFTQSEARHDLLRPLENPRASIDIVKILLWVVAGLIIASVVYLTALERTRDIAVFKATGVGNAAIGAGICLQAVILAVLASLVGNALAVLLARWFPMEVTITTASMLQMPLLAVVVGVLAGLVGVRRTTSIAPATAFGGP